MNNHFDWGTILPTTDPFTFRWRCVFLWTLTNMPHQDYMEFWLKLEEKWKGADYPTMNKILDRAIAWIKNKEQK